MMWSVPNPTDTACCGAQIGEGPRQTNQLHNLGGGLNPDLDRGHTHVPLGQVQLNMALAHRCKQPAVCTQVLAQKRGAKASTPAHLSTHTCEGTCHKLAERTPR